MQRRSRALVAVMACMTWAASPAVRADAPVPAVRPMYFEHLTTRDGLSQSTINGILQDSQGYLWLATENGLDRYDGDTIRSSTGSNCAGDCFGFDGFLHFGHGRRRNVFKRVDRTGYLAVDELLSE